jgi:heme a synthase
MTSLPRSDSSRPTHRHFHRIAWLAVALALGIIVFGAFVRLSHAGLSCPDWPTCYGRATWPSHAAEAAGHEATAVRVFEDSKAWREQVHRHLAAILGLIVLVLALLGARRRPRGILQVLAAAGLVALSIPLYMQANYTLAAVLAIAGELILLAAAFRWNDTDLARISAITLMVIVVQALLGMWTVTWLLKPVVVMAHLLGGLTTFSLLLWMAWRATDLPIRLAQARELRRWLWIALAVLGVQIALGGWVSANYAALACGTYFPTCAGTWTPPADFREGFVLWRGIGVDFEGGILDGASRIAIQLAHRIGAIVATLALLALAVRLLRTPGLRGWGALVALLTLAQVSLGIANVQMSLPLGIAVAHNAGAALLLATLVSLLARIKPPRVATAA